MMIIRMTMLTIVMMMLDVFLQAPVGRQFDHCDDDGDDYVDHCDNDFLQAPVGRQ